MCEAPPSPRANFTVTSLPSGEMVLFGGEYFDGQDTRCFNKLFRSVPYKAFSTAVYINTYLTLIPSYYLHSKPECTPEEFSVCNPFTLAPTFVGTMI